MDQQPANRHTNRHTNRHANQDATGREDFTDFVGHTVVDEHDHEIGTVTDVSYDDAADRAGSAGERPAWLVVDPGMFRAAHWMPAAGTYRSADDRIVTPWDRELVKHAPKATDDHLMTPRLAHELERHYEVSSLR